MEGRLKFPGCNIIPSHYSQADVPQCHKKANTYLSSFLGDFGRKMDVILITVYVLLFFGSAPWLNTSAHPCIYLEESCGWAVIP